ncbi:hypothetical protein [Salinispora arenicola]|uniref:hypothetical protein n=1 Tax=Salinispora arenicola TaxID=168697 RepID=UPI0016A75065|nr:hypothetical protein [Salinispora arenicola]NIL55621.1 hypothetical protein [Salinispora arenicola]NIL64372.1 hypothetical protein [Salinispora arenicola]
MPDGLLGNEIDLPVFAHATGTDRATLVPVSVTVSKKSAAMRPWARERRNVAQVLFVRSGAGSTPAFFRIS